jgi:hypothetical protein
MSAALWLMSHNLRFLRVQQLSLASSIQAGRSNHDLWGRISVADVARPSGCAGLQARCVSVALMREGRDPVPATTAKTQRHAPANVL